MESVPVLFNEKLSFSELVARAREELHCHGDDGITVEGVLHLGSPSNILWKMIPIGCADLWEKIGYEEPIPKFGCGCASGGT